MDQFNQHSLEVDGHRVAYYEGGSGYPLLLIHGSGPGASTAGNWGKILGPLAEQYHVFAMDLIGFGESERKREEPYFDMILWQKQCAAMADKIPGDGFGVIAHSISAALALHLAANDNRVDKLLTTGAMGAHFLANEGTVACWTFPENVEALRKAVGYLVNNKTLIDEKYLEARIPVLFGDPTYKDYFTKMFSGDRQKYIEKAIVDPKDLAKITCDVKMLHGRQDEPFPPEISLEIAKHIPQADIELLSNCSHSIALERTVALLSAASSFFPGRDHKI